LTPSTQRAAATAIESPTHDPSLSVFQRVLLITDGTVTHLLEAYAEEPVRVVKLAQSSLPAGGGAGQAGATLPGPGTRELQLADGEEVLHREVLLQGSATGRNYIHAESVVVASRLPRTLRDGLMLTDEPIGRLLDRHRTETFREVVACGRQAVGARGAHFGLDAGACAISRRCRVLAETRPVMLISETFPSDAFASPAADESSMPTARESMT
jgi:chorismate-pyruvate lyase